MRQEIARFIYFSEIINLPVVSARDERLIGRVVDLAAATGQVYPRTTGLMTRISGFRDPVYIPWSSVQKASLPQALYVEYDPDAHPAHGAEDEILLKKTFFDRQIISTSGYKVLRVNDLHMLIDSSAKGTPNLWLVHIDVGIKGLLRRLGWLRGANAVFKWVVSRDIKDKFVSWKYVQPTSATNIYGSLRLTTDPSKLSEIHPADLADIAEDLGTEERASLIESLDAATAAATLQEMPLKIRIQIVETLAPERMAAIVNEMHMDDAVDLLDELDPDRQNTIFGRLTKEKVADIKELSQLSAHRVGRIMNSDFLAAREDMLVQDVLINVQAECGKAEVYRYIYILDHQDRLKGIVTLRQLLSSHPTTKIADIMRESLTTVSIDTSLKRVAQIFIKYNFEALPVVDEAGRLQGIVTLRDTFASVFPEIREASKG